MTKPFWPPGTYCWGEEAAAAGAAGEAAVYTGGGWGVSLVNN